MLRHLKVLLGSVLTLPNKVENSVYEFGLCGRLSVWQIVCALTLENILELQCKFHRFIGVEETKERLKKMKYVAFTFRSQVHKK